MAPQIPGLPNGRGLTDLVTTHALAVYADGLVDENLRGLSDRDRRTVLAGRVGLRLGFPAPRHPRP